MPNMKMKVKELIQIPGAQDRLKAALPESMAEQMKGDIPPLMKMMTLEGMVSAPMLPLDNEQREHLRAVIVEILNEQEDA